MTHTHKVSLVLSAIAFILFDINFFAELAGWGALDFHGIIGAIVLTVFLAVGLLIQLAKLYEGHRRAIDLLITLIMLPTHVFGALAIWYRTQIIHAGLPADLPLYIVGLYWLIGVVEIVARTIKRELQLFKKGHILPQDEVALLKHELALKEQSLSSAQQSLSKFEQQEAKREEEKARTYTEVCPMCTAKFKHNKQESAERALRAHMSRVHRNGHSKQPIPQREETSHDPHR